MSQHTTLRSGAQFQSFFRSLVLDPTLLFAHILSTEIIAQIVLEEIGETTDRIFTPLVTLATFLSQILSDDHSCRGAVARLKAWRVAHGFPAHWRPEVIAGHGNACPSRSCRDWRASPRIVSRSEPPKTGIFTSGRSSWSMGLASPCPTRARTKRSTPSTSARTRLRLPDRPDRRPPIPGHRGSSRPGHSALERQAHRRERPAARVAKPPSARQYPTGRQLLQLLPGGRSIDLYGC